MPLNLQNAVSYGGYRISILTSRLSILFENSNIQNNVENA